MLIHWARNNDSNNNNSNKNSSILYSTIKNSEQLHLAYRQKAVKRKKRAWSWMTFFQNNKRTAKRGWIEVFLLLILFLYCLNLTRQNDEKGKQSGPCCTTAAITCCMNVYKCVRCVSMYSIICVPITHNMGYWIKTKSWMNPKRYSGHPKWYSEHWETVLHLDKWSDGLFFMPVFSIPRNLANIHILIGIDDNSRRLECKLWFQAVSCHANQCHWTHSKSNTQRSTAPARTVLFFSLHLHNHLCPFHQDGSTFIQSTN